MERTETNGSHYKLTQTAGALPEGTAADIYGFLALIHLTYLVLERQRGKTNSQDFKFINLREFVGCQLTVYVESTC